MLRYIRIGILLTILVVVAGNQWLTENRFSSWEKPLWISIYPVLAEPGEGVRRYAENLDAAAFEDIVEFFGQQARRYGRELEPAIVIQVARPLTAQPPALPTEGSRLDTALWSLKMRWWSWRNGRQDGMVSDDVRMYVLYQERKPDTALERSVGIKNGSYGLVNAVASRREAAHNRIVIAHELLHILGAIDKYDLNTGQPLPPGGLADPSKSPLYPQERAEIMGGRIAVSANRWRHPASLAYCVIGAETAAEIGWITNQP
ncbi:MAG: hypothetical protein KJN61_05415 [Gammaproteobacteria bacterium]|nr:hypothetical protein [Gammaproteobacteria bacterium]MBT8075887.1 hypothetical protein [Gammaproteobacteria bacterium]NNK99883.1 hypothetical protein [Xanthomonadales bacterium]